MEIHFVPIKYPELRNLKIQSIGSYVNELNILNPLSKGIHWYNYVGKRYRIIIKYSNKFPMPASFLKKHFYIWNGWSTQKCLQERGS